MVNVGWNETEWLPKWRHATRPITIIDLPTARWFADKHHTRFVVLVDGRVLWGDGHDVVHNDLVYAAKLVAGCAALIQGVAMRAETGPRDRRWFLASLEYSPFAHEKDDEVSAVALLHKLTTWMTDVRAIGYPHRFDHQNLEHISELYGRAEAKEG